MIPFKPTCIKLSSKKLKCEDKRIHGVVSLNIANQELEHIIFFSVLLLDLVLFLSWTSTSCASGWDSIISSNGSYDLAYCLAHPIPSIFHGLE